VIMRVGAVLLGVTLAGSVAQAAPCEVSIERAPDDVRAAIERWVAGEPSCGGPLAVRVVETDEGLYVIATDAEHQTIDREVPDAESAGALVASWAVAAVPTRPPVLVELEVGPEAQDLYGLRPYWPAIVDEEVVPERAMPRAPRVRRFAAIGTTYGTGAIYSGRAFERSDLHSLSAFVVLDLVGRGAWSGGVRVALSGYQHRVTSSFGMVVFGHAAWTSAPRAWRVRASARVGLAHGWDWRSAGPVMSRTETSVPVQLGAVVSRSVRAGLAVAVGPQLTTLAPVGATAYEFNSVTLGIDVALQGRL